MFDSIIFDLDGTLWDTCESCALGWNQVLQRNQIPFRKIVAEDVRSVAGKPHRQCIEEVFTGLTPQTLDLLSHETAVEDNRAVEKWGGILYEGVVEGIQKLSQSFPLFIVSNCQDGYIETFLKHSQLNSHFRDHECWGRTGKPKSQNIESVVKRNHLQTPVYIGDTEGDQTAAKDAGLPFLFASYGFGNGVAAKSFPSFGDICDHLLTPVSQRNHSKLL